LEVGDGSWMVQGSALLTLQFSHQSIAISMPSCCRLMSLLQRDHGLLPASPFQQKRPCGRDTSGKARTKACFHPGQFDLTDTFAHRGVGSTAYLGVAHRGYNKVDCRWP
jgi:hypothetical protein